MKPAVTTCQNLPLMKRWNAAFAARLVSCSCALVLFGTAGCTEKASRNKGEEPVPVRTLRVETRTLTRTLDYAAGIKAQNDAMVYPKVTGKIIEKLKEEGAAVEKGEIIAFIDRDEIGFKFEKSPVDAPLAGLIGSVYVDKGDSVSPQTAIAFIVDIDNVRTVLEAPEKYLPLIAPGQNAIVSVDAFPREIFKGKVSKISPVVDLQTRTVPVEIFIANPEHKLKPGMFARIKLILEETNNAILVPKEAVIGRDTEAFVYTLEGKTARRRAVQTGLRDGGEIEIRHGLAPGDLIVIMGQQKLRDGMEVIVDTDNVPSRNKPTP